MNGGSPVDQPIFDLNAALVLRVIAPPMASGEYTPDVGTYPERVGTPEIRRSIDGPITHSPQGRQAQRIRLEGVLAASHLT